MQVPRGRRELKRIRRLKHVRGRGEALRNLNKRLARHLSAPLNKTPFEPPPYPPPLDYPARERSEVVLKERSFLRFTREAGEIVRISVWLRWQPVSFSSDANNVRVGRLSTSNSPGERENRCGLLIVGRPVS